MKIVALYTLLTHRELVAKTVTPGKLRLVAYLCSTFSSKAVLS